jgi:hypothetical protein
MSRWGDSVATVALLGVAGSWWFGIQNHRADTERLKDEAKAVKLAQSAHDAALAKMKATASLQIYSAKKDGWTTGKNGTQFTPDQESAGSINPVMTISNSGGSKGVITDVGIVPRAGRFISAPGLTCYYSKPDVPSTDCPTPIGLDPAQRVTIWFELTPELLKQATCTDESDGGLQVYYTTSDGIRSVVKTGTALQEASRCPIKPTVAPNH